MTAPKLSLFLFTTDCGLARHAVAAGIDGAVVDWEQAGKRSRQDGFDTEINADSPEDLGRLTAAGIPRRLCRVNAFGPQLAAEVESALANGATDVLLPMVTSAAEVTALLRQVDGRGRTGILVETREACAHAAELAALAVDFVYVGLNDLAISRRSASIFTAVADGTVERLRSVFVTQAFGFGGLTVLDGGTPIPCARLLEEMARLACDFTFLRRSFKREIVARDMGAEVARLRDRFAALGRRDPGERDRDRGALLAAIQRAEVARSA
ncbi:MAG: aldolase [Deltaproteobacteria bacterium]|nr:aldolase [Deltaproteobacteria bacterium]